MPNSAKPTARGVAATKVTVVIPNWNGMPWLPGCLRALRQQTFTGFSTLIVDNGSTDGSVEYLRKEHPDIELVCLPTNTGFAHAANVGIEKTSTPYVALLNTDTEADRDWLRCLVETMDRAEPEIAAVTSQMLRLDQPDLTDNAGDELSWYGGATKRGHGRPATEYTSPGEVFSPCAGATLYRRDFLRAMGGFDESFFAYLEDVDLGLRGRLRGYRYLYQPGAKVLHAGHGAGIREDRYVELITKNRLLVVCEEHSPCLAASARGQAHLWPSLLFCRVRPPLGLDKGLRGLF